jgi:hypothetical protein
MTDQPEHPDVYRQLHMLRKYILNKNDTTEEAEAAFTAVHTAMWDLVSLRLALEPFSDAYRAAKILHPKDENLALMHMWESVGIPYFKKAASFFIELEDDQ